MYMRKMTVLAVAAFILTGLGGCREEDRNRPLSAEKGVYSGPTGTALTDDQKRMLRNRSRLQAGGSI